MFLTLLFWQCEKETKEIDNPPAKIDVSAFTPTDIYGNLMGTADSTDWTEDQVWAAEEYNLFQSPSLPDLADTKTGAVTIFPVFPNPMAEFFTLVYKADDTAFLQLVVTDSLLQVKDRYAVHTGTGSRMLAIKLNADNYVPNTNYRLYYGFSSAADKLFFKGHGDIRIRQ